MKSLSIDPIRSNLRCVFAAIISTLATAAMSNPADELAAMRVADGYEVNLFASEEQGVVKPIQLRFDPRGRLWVVGSTVYPQIEPGQTPDDKVVMLEDVDGDGRADKSQVFAGGLMIPTGLELGDGGVYVGQTTQLLHLKDTDGDGVADERRIVLRGFGTGDSHQTINSFTWTPGGELMMCQGLHAFSRVETPWGLERLDTAGIWRFHPRLLRLDAFLHQAMGPHNPFGIAFDRWGQPIVLAGNGHGIYYLTPAMIRAKHHLPFDWIWNKGRKFGGGDFVENSHFPPEAQGELITGGYLNNSVERFRISDNGAGFSVEELPPLITSTNKSFRIVDVRFGPDGALYLCDWYNPVIGHYQTSFRHPDRDKVHGRIWRVTAKGRPLVTRPQLPTESISVLLEQLKSPERWNRQMAKRVLADRPTGGVTNAVEGWIASLDAADPNHEHNLFEALGVYESHEVASPKLLGRLLQAQDPRARAYATRVIGRWHSRLPNAVEWLRTQANDPNPRVRLESVVAASYLPSARAVEAALAVLDHPMDRFIEYALTQTIHTLKPHWRDALLAGHLDFAEHPNWLEYLLKTDRSADSIGFVLARLESPALAPTLREQFLRILCNVGGPDELSRVLSRKSYQTSGSYDSDLHARLLPELAEVHRLRELRPSGDLVQPLRELIESGHGHLSSEAMKLAGEWKLEALRPVIERNAVDRAGDAEKRRAAAVALGHYADTAARGVLARIATNSAPAVQSAAISALAPLDVAAAAEAASRTFQRECAENELIEIYSAFLGRTGGASALAAALAQLPPSKTAAESGLRLMNASGRRDEALARILIDAAGLRGGFAELSADELLVLVGEVRANGDAKRGAEIYHREELGCVACHAIGGSGGVIGPDLGALGTAQTFDFIIGAILFPNREVKEGYMSTAVVTKDGEEFQGYIVRDEKRELVLRDVLQQREIRIARDQIQSQRQHGSLMPAGLADTLSRAEFRDLIRFLAELGTHRR